MICAALFERNPSLLPVCRVSRAPSGGASTFDVKWRLGVHVPGTKDAGVPSPLSRTNRTSLVRPLVLSGHAASLTPY